MNVYDYVTLVIILIIPILIGLYFGYKNVINRCLNNQSEKKAALSEYLVANSDMGSVPIAFSLLATFVSTTTLLGAPVEVYQNGIQYWIVSFGFFVTPLLGCFVTGPFFARIKVMSVYEYFERRFDSKNVRLIGMMCYVIGTILSTAIYIYGPSASLDALTNLGEFTSIGIIGTIATFYTAIGGIKAVIWTDFYQILIMISSLIIICVKGIIDIGGFNNMWQINIYGERLQLFDFNPDPFIRQSFWSQSIGFIIVLSLFYSVDQQMIQRFQASKNKKTAQKALLYHMPLIFLFFTLVCLTGLVMYANYFTCDLISSKKILNSNQLLGYFVTNSLNDINGIAGLFLGSLFCASFSSISSTLSSLSAIIWQDFCLLIPFFKRFNDSKSVTTTKLLVFTCGFISTGLAFILAAIKGNLIILSSSLQGAFAAPIMGVFILGSLFSFTNTYGVIMGTIFGFLAGSWLSLGSNLVQPNYPKLYTSIEYCNNTNMSNYEIYEYLLKDKIIESNKYNSTIFANGKRATNLDGFNVFYSLSYMYTFSFGLLVTIIFGILFSLITKGYKNKIDKSFLVYDLCKYFKINNKVQNRSNTLVNYNNNNNQNDMEMSENETLT